MKACLLQKPFPNEDPGHHLRIYGKLQKELNFKDIHKWKAYSTQCLFSDLRPFYDDYNFNGNIQILKFFNLICKNRDLLDKSKRKICNSLTKNK